MLASKINPPAAAPWIARPAISMPILVEVAQTIELKKNSAIDANTIGFRPQMSDSLAHIGPDAAFEMRYAPPIQVYPEAD
jgi:hypothetical protein